MIWSHETHANSAQEGKKALERGHLCYFIYYQAVKSHYAANYAANGESEDSQGWTRTESKLSVILNYGNRNRLDD